MTTQTEALKLALEALGLASAMAAEHNESEMEYAFEFTINKLEKTFKEALSSEAMKAKPEQEPVARVVEHGATVKLEWANADAAHNAKVGNLYTTPPQRKPLTDEEIGAILEGVNAYGTRLYTFARAIEAKLKEKNT